MATPAPDVTKPSEDHVPVAKDDEGPGSMQNVQQTENEATDLVKETKEENTDSKTEPDAVAPTVPVNVKAADAANLALQNFMASEELASATSAPSASKVSSLPDPIWKAVDDTFKAPTCRKCMMPCNVENVVNKTKAEGRVNVVCRGCNSATTMLSRHLGQWPVPAFSGLTQEQQIGFWKQCHDIIQNQGRLDYGSIRACLTISLTERRSEVASAKFTSEYLPVSVWTTRGFKEEDVRKGLKEIHPLLGETSAVPLKTVSKEHIRARVEEMITTFEAQVRKKKNGKASQPASSAVSTSLPDGDDPDLLDIEWLDAKSPAKKRPADELDKLMGPPEDASAPDPKKQRQMANQVRRHNVAVGKLASKSLDVLNPLLGVLVKHQANIDVLPAALVTELSDVQSELGELISQCQEGLRTPSADERLPDLPFDSKTLSSKTRSFKQVFANVDRMMKLITKSMPKAK